MADINNQLDKTEKELKDVEQQAIKTESAVKKVTEAEHEAMMHAALQAASRLSTADDSAIKKQTDAIKEQEKEVKSLNKELEKYTLTANGYGITKKIDVSKDTFSKVGTLENIGDILHKGVSKYDSSLLRAGTQYRTQSMYDNSEADIINNIKDAEEHFKEYIVNYFRETLGNRQNTYNELVSMLKQEENDVAKEILKIIENNDKIKQAIARQNTQFSDEEIKQVRNIGKSFLTKNSSKEDDVFAKYRLKQDNEWIKHANPYDIVQRYWRALNIDQLKSLQNIIKDEYSLGKINKMIDYKTGQTDTVKQIEQVPEQVKEVTDKVVKAVETATNTVKENVNSTVQYVNNAVNGFTLVGGIAEQVKKQFALVPVGKPYVKGNNFNMYDPDAKQLPAVINDSTTALSTEFNNDVIERIKLFYEYLKRIAVLKQSLRGNFNIDSGIGAPEGAFSNSINNLADNAQRQQQEEIKNTEKAYEELRNKVSDVMSSIKHAISNVIGVIRTANNILHKVGSTIISVFNGAMHTVQRIIQLFGNLGNRVGLTNKNTNILKGSFTELKSAIDLLAGAFNKLFNNQFIEQGRKLLSSIQSLKMLMGNDLTTATIEWANQMEDAFGLSANELITNLREVTAVMYGLGMSAKDVQVGARNLESVGMVLSSISGLGFDVVMSKIQSGMKGMTQAIDDLGLSVRESQMDAYLKKLKAQGGEFANISTSFSSLNEQQRVYVRYAAIMDQFMTKEAYTVENYAKALRTTTGSINVLTSQLNGLKSSIGTLALGLFSKVLQPLIYIVYYIRQLIIQLGTFLGIKMKLDANMNGGDGVDTSPVEDETDALDEMTDAANKAKGALDELDHISTMSSSSGSGKGTGSNFDYSSLLGGYDFADALAEYDANFIEECKQRLIDMVEHLLNRITEFIKEFTGRVISWKTIKENLDAVWTHVKSIFYNILNIAKTTFGIISGLIYDVFNDLGFTTLLKKLTGVLTTFTFGVDTMLKRIAPYITKFYNKYIAGYVREFGQLLSEKLDWLQEKANAFAEKWLNMDDATLEAKMDALGEKFNKLLTTLKEIAILFKTIFGKDTDTDNTFFNDNASENMKKFKETAEKLHEVLSSLWDIIKGIAHEIADVNDDGVVDSKDLGTVIDKINEKLERVKNWLSENKEEIISLVENVAKTLGKLAETKFDILMTVLEFITSHADLINSVLDTIQKILDFVSEHPALSFGIAIGVQLAGHVIKTAATALIWKTILGTGSGGGLATAVSGIWGSISTKIGALATSIGSAIKNGITNAISGINWSAVATTIKNGLMNTGLPLMIAGSLTIGVKEALNTFDEDFIGKDGNKLKNDRDFDTLDNGTLQKQADAYYKVLRDNFGYEIPRIAIDNAVEMARQQLEASGKYTAEQIDRMVAIVEEDIYEDIEHPIHNLANTGDWDAITNHVSVVDVEMTSLKDTFETTSESAVKSLDEITYQFDDIEQSTSTSLSSINGNVTTLDDIINGTANNVSSSISLIEQAASRASLAVQSFSNAFKELFSSNIAEKLRELADIKINIGNFGAAANLINGTKTTSVKGFKGYANGGLPSTGSLFMANEDGNTELVGNFGGYTGVANQSMIISAMESAVYNAVTQALKANGGNGGQTTIEVCKGGVFVGDEAGIRKLANQINNINATGRTNIANVGFSMT